MLSICSFSTERKYDELFAQFKEKESVVQNLLRSESTLKEELQKTHARCAPDIHRLSKGIPFVFTHARLNNRNAEVHKRNEALEHMLHDQAIALQEAMAKNHERKKVGP